MLVIYGTYRYEDVSVYGTYICVCGWGERDGVQDRVCFVLLVTGSIRRDTFVLVVTHTSCVFVLLTLVYLVLDETDVDETDDRRDRAGGVCLAKAVSYCRDDRRRRRATRAKARQGFTEPSIFPFINLTNHPIPSK